MKLENDKIYKLYTNNNLYIVQCINVELRDFKPLKSYCPDLNEYWDVDVYTVEEYELKELLKHTSKKYKLKEFDKFEHLI